MVAYRVRVQSFCDADGDGVGDFEGLTSKLDHLEDLGVGTLELMPIELSEERYEAFAALLEAAVAGKGLTVVVKDRATPGSRHGGSVEEFSPLNRLVIDALATESAAPLAEALRDQGLPAAGVLSTCPPASAVGGAECARRRLASRLGGERPRIELAFSLLLTLPGRPAILYGDEIGLGDYPLEHGGHGVYPPMQWSVARNAGFSGAPEERLERPLLTDPAFHYAEVNVRRQQDDKDSLLKAVSRMVGHRRDHRALSEGMCVVLPCGNPHVLAVVRSVPGAASVLTVHNLARTFEEATLDVTPWAGAMAADVLAFQVFGPLPAGETALVLPPSGYFWFRLEPQPATAG